jgi:hypothetical protein
MPPKHPLPDSEVRILEQWVRRGADLPKRSLDLYSFSTDRRAGYDWWSLQPVVKPRLPVSKQLPGLDPIDAFVLDKLSAAQLAFSPKASRRDFIRRVCIDLTGLPPSYDEVVAFEKDASPQAADRLVDRLLASSAYGERWGRHWLDVVHFAESHGFERDRIRESSWPYRDYVIEAFNSDMPFDQFVREQIAGDAYAPSEPRGAVALGFLAAGPKNDVGTISELEKLTTRQDELDDFVVSSMTTFVGLSVGCARCHDHKFDPIPAKDYYQLTAIFSGLDQKEMESASPVQRAQRAATLAALEVQRLAAKGAIARLIDPAKKELLARSRSGSAPATLPAVVATENEDSFDPVDARFLRFTVERTNTGNEPAVDELQAFGDDPAKNLAVAANGGVASASSLLPGFAIHQIGHLNDDKADNDHSWISAEPNSGWAQIAWRRPQRLRRVVWSRDRSRRFADRLPTEYRLEASLDGKTWRRVSGSDRRAPVGGDIAAQQLDEQALALLTDSQRREVDAWIGKLAELESAIKQVPSLPVSYSVRDGKTTDAFRLNRGDVRQRAEKVEPGVLSAIRGVEYRIPAGEADTGPRRRKELAQWLTNPKNPLTARVFVNRVWHYHFGQGLVATPSDFGFNGDRPSHPELLDWLAADFMENGWKIKRLHKQIVLSQVYGQSSQSRDEAAAKDGSNRLLWRMSPRRMEAEALRDAVLLASGSLDRTMGGPSARLFRYRDGNVPDYLLLERQPPETWRRGVYLFNVRSFREPLLAAFDCPDPAVATPKRERSTTALQALSLMNSTFMVEQSDRFAARILREAGPESPAQAARAYRIAFSRDPSEKEKTDASEFIGEHGLAALCRVLYNASEFLYVP